MTDFGDFHPGSKLALDLYNQKEIIQNTILDNVSIGFNILQSQYGFGGNSDTWDDYVFNVIFETLLSANSTRDLQTAIEFYSEIDHRLFLLYLRRDEDPYRFRRSFWNLNKHGRALSERFASKVKLTTSLNFHESESANKRRIGFLFKGPFKLAHAEFFTEFLRGTRYFQDRVEIHLILIDEKRDILTHKDFSHLHIHRLLPVRAYDKLLLYTDLVNTLALNHVSWVACVQNLSLYMGHKFAPMQSYWSMKYHSIIMSSLDLYAGLGFGGEPFEFDGVKWYRGRAFPDLSFPDISQSQAHTYRSKHNIPDDATLAGCFVRSEKLNCPEFWSLIHRLLLSNHNLFYVIASQSLPQISTSYLVLPVFKKRFRHLGWVNTKKYCQILNIYLDSFPRGSCLTALEAIKAGVPTVIFDTQHNRESSALPYISAGIPSNHSLEDYGVLSTSDPFEYINSLISSRSNQASLSRRQKSILSALNNQSVLFAKDYLSFLLGTPFPLVSK